MGKYLFQDIRKSINYRKMHNALSLNGAITNESQNAELVVVNMPLPPSSYDQGIIFYQSTYAILLIYSTHAKWSK